MSETMQAAITLTPDAARQILVAAQAAGEEAVLRVAARRTADGSLDYGMGFDELRPDDLELQCEGIAVVVAPPSRVLLAGTTIDYVEVAPGDFRFVFAAPAEEPNP